MSAFFSGGHGDPLTFQAALVALLVTYCLTQALAGVYIWTFRGMSYTTGLVHAIVLGGLVACTLMMAIGDSIAAGIGVAGGLALVRFRTALREPRDMMFVFAALGAGIAAGLQAFPVAIVGTLAFALVAHTLAFSEFGAQRRIDGLLRFQLPPSSDESALSRILEKHTDYVALVTLREVGQGTALEHAYQVRIDDPSLRKSLVLELEKIPGIRSVSLLLQEPTVEL